MSETAPRVRVLLMADSHLGFDHPVHPRVKRRRRGEDFLRNHQRALAAAMERRVDLVVHGGDLFHRPGVPPSLVHQAFEPLKTVAEAGIPVFLVPGNHERSRIPYDWIARHPRVHVFAAPGTVRRDVGGLRVAVSGLPCLRKRARARFEAELARTEWDRGEADVRLLVTHQAFEGATVGPSDYVFRRNADVVRHRDVPAGFAAVLSGHIHRHQVLRHDLQGRPLPTPVFYPGSVERTAFAEMGEMKGFVELVLAAGGEGGRVASWAFHELYARPMRSRTLDAAGSRALVEARLRSILESEPEDAVLRVRVDGTPRRDTRAVLTAGSLRRLAPGTMNVDLVGPAVRRWSGGGRRSFRAGGGRPAEGAGGPGALELELGL